MPECSPPANDYITLPPLSKLQKDSENFNFSKGWDKKIFLKDLIFEMGSDERMFKLLKKRKGLIKYSDRKRLLIISNKAIKKIAKIRYKLTDVESGGILLGKIYYSYDVISDITLPCKKDKKGVSYFIRSFKRANKVIKQEWQKSKGKINYLGEWHTHKETNPTPSAIDERMIKDVFLDVGLEIDQVYLFIIGIENSIWIGKQKNKNLYKLEKIN